MIVLTVGICRGGVGPDRGVAGRAVVGPDAEGEVGVDVGGGDVGVVTAALRSIMTPVMPLE